MVEYIYFFKLFIYPSIPGIFHTLTQILSICLVTVTVLTHYPFLCKAHREKERERLRERERSASVQSSKNVRLQVCLVSYVGWFAVRSVEVFGCQDDWGTVYVQSQGGGPHLTSFQR